MLFASVVRSKFTEHFRASSNRIFGQSVSPAHSAHLSSQFLHVGVQFIQQVVALLEQRTLRVHEGQHLHGKNSRNGHINLFVEKIQMDSSEFTYSIKNLKLLLCLKDVDLQKKTD